MCNNISNCRYLVSKLKHKRNPTKKKKKTYYTTYVIYHCTHLSLIRIKRKKGEQNLF
jgi:hypothetical protein